nr:hypothetical protein [Verrucomicrobiae bacterium]
MFASLGCFLLGFVSWMLGNSDVKEVTDFRYWFHMGGVALILLGVVGLMASMVSFSNGWSQLKRFGAFVLVAALLSLLSFAILFLEYGVFNFGDSDLPPYWPDTPFEKAFDFVWFTVTIGAALLWLFAIIYVIALLFRAVKQRVA